MTQVITTWLCLIDKDMWTKGWTAAHTWRTTMSRHKPAAHLSWSPVPQVDWIHLLMPHATAPQCKPKPGMRGAGEKNMEVHSLPDQGTQAKAGAPEVCDTLRGDWVSPHSQGGLTLVVALRTSCKRVT